MSDNLFQLDGELLSTGDNEINMGTDASGPCCCKFGTQSPTFAPSWKVTASLGSGSYKWKLPIRAVRGGTFYGNYFRGWLKVTFSRGGTWASKIELPQGKTAYKTQPTENSHVDLQTFIDEADPEEWQWHGTYWSDNMGSPTYARREEMGYLKGDQDFTSQATTNQQPHVTNGVPAVSFLSKKNACDCTGGASGGARPKGLAHWYITESPWASILMESLENFCNCNVSVIKYDDQGQYYTNGFVIKNFDVFNANDQVGSMCASGQWGCSSRCIGSGSSGQWARLWFWSTYMRHLGRNGWKTWDEAYQTLVSDGYGAVYPTKEHFIGAAIEQGANGATPTKYGNTSLSGGTTMRPGYGFDAGSGSTYGGRFIYLRTDVTTGTHHQPFSEAGGAIIQQCRQAGPSWTSPPADTYAPRLVIIGSDDEIESNDCSYWTDLYPDIVCIDTPLQLGNVQANRNAKSIHQQVVEGAEGGIGVWEIDQPYRDQYEDGPHCDGSYCRRGSISKISWTTGGSNESSLFSSYASQNENHDKYTCHQNGAELDDEFVDDDDNPMDSCRASTSKYACLGDTVNNIAMALYEISSNSSFSTTSQPTVCSFNFHEGGIDSMYDNPMNDCSTTKYARTFNNFGDSSFKWGNSDGEDANCWQYPNTRYQGQYTGAIDYGCSPDAGCDYQSSSTSDKYFPISEHESRSSSIHNGGARAMAYDENTYHESTLNGDFALFHGPEALFTGATSQWEPHRRAHWDGVVAATCKAGEPPYLANEDIGFNACRSYGCQSIITNSQPSAFCWCGGSYKKQTPSNAGSVGVTDYTGGDNLDADGDYESWWSTTSTNIMPHDVDSAKAAVQEAFDYISGGGGAGTSVSLPGLSDRTFFDRHPCKDESSCAHVYNIYNTTSSNPGSCAQNPQTGIYPRNDPDHYDSQLLHPDISPTTVNDSNLTNSSVNPYCREYCSEGAGNKVEISFSNFDDAFGDASTATIANLAAEPVNRSSSPYIKRFRGVDSGATICPDPSKHNIIDNGRRHNDGCSDSHIEDNYPQLYGFQRYADLDYDGPGTCPRNQYIDAPFSHATESCFAYTFDCVNNAYDVGLFYNLQTGWRDEKFPWGPGLSSVEDCPAKPASFEDHRPESMGGDGINPNEDTVFYIHIDGEDEIEFTVDCPWSGHVLSKMIIKQHLSQVPWCDGCFVRSQEPEAGSELFGECIAPSSTEIWDPDSDYNPINPQWNLTIEPFKASDGGPTWMAKPEDADGQNVPEEEYSEIAVHYDHAQFGCFTRYKNSSNEPDTTNCEEAHPNHPNRPSGWSWEKAREGKGPGYNIDGDDCCWDGDSLVNACAPIEGLVPDICCDCVACNEGGIPLGPHPGSHLHYSTNIYNCELTADCYEDDALCRRNCNGMGGDEYIDGCGNDDSDPDCSQNPPPDNQGNAWPYTRCPNAVDPATIEQEEGEGEGEGEEEGGGEEEGD